MDEIKYYKVTKPNEVKAVVFHKLTAVLSSQDFIVDKLKELYEKANCIITEIDRDEYYKLKNELEWEGIM